MADNELRIRINTTADTAAIRATIGALEGVERVSSSASNGIRHFEDNVNNASQSSNRFTSIINDSIGSVKNLVLGYFALNSIMEGGIAFIETADSINNLNGRLALATSSTAEFASQQKELLGIALATHTPLKGITDLYIKLDPALKAMGATTATVNKVTEDFAKGLKLGGASVEEAAAATLQFGQAMGSGVLRGDEFNSMMEASPKLMSYMAEGMNVPIGALRKMAENGELTSGKVSAALLKMSGDIDRDYKKLPQTVGNSMVDLGISVSKAVGEFDQMHGITLSISSSISGLTKYLNENADSLDTVARYAKDAGLAMGLLYGGSTVIAGITAVRTAIGGLTLAQYAFNTATRANPYMLVGMALIGGVTLLYDALQKAEDKAKATYNAAMQVEKSASDYYATNEGKAVKLANSYNALENSLKGLEKSRLNATGSQANSLDKAIENTKSNMLKLQNLAKDIKATASTQTLDEQIAKLQKASILPPNASKKQLAEDKKSAAEKEKAFQEEAKIQKGYLESYADLEAKAAIEKYDNEIKLMEDNADREAKAAIAQYELDLWYIDDLASRQASSALTIFDLTRSEADKINDQYLSLYETSGHLFDEETKNKFFTKWQEQIDGIKSKMDFSASIEFDPSSLDGMQKGIAAVGKSMSNLTKLEQQYNKNKNITGATAEELAKNEDDYNKSQIAGYANLAGAMSKSFKEGSDAANAFIVVQKALVMVEAVSGIVAQSKLPFPANLAAMAATAASVFSFMSSIGVGGSSGSVSAPPPSATEGTVLGGGAYGQSESTTAITDLLSSIHTSEYSQLRDINRATTSMASSINSAVANIFKTGIGDTSGVALSSSSGASSSSSMLGAFGATGAGLAATYGTGLAAGALGMTGIGLGVMAIDQLLLGGALTNIIGGTVSKALGAIGLGGSSKQYIAGSGFNVSGGTLSDKTNNAGASTYVDVETASKNFFGSASYSHNITTTALDEASSKSISLIYKSFSDTMIAVNKGLGTDLGDSIAGYAVKAINISTAGLTGEEVVKKLNDTFSALGDTMANDVFGEVLDQYQKLGEGMLETAVRVITEKAVVLQDLGDVGIAVNGDILSVSQSLVELSGSLDNFQDSIASYYDKFFTDAEKQARSQDKFMGLFTDLNMTMPTTVEAFRSIVDSLDLTTLSGQETFTMLMASSSAFYDFATAVEESTKTVTDSILSTVTTFISAFDDLKKSTQSLIDSLSIPTNTSGKQDYLITQYQDLKSSFMSNFDSNGMADANSIEKMKADYASLTSNISALSGAGINDMTKSALVAELGSFNSLFTKNEQAVKVEVVSGTLDANVIDMATLLGLNNSQLISMGLTTSIANIDSATLSSLLKLTNTQIDSLANISSGSDTSILSLSSILGLSSDQQKTLLSMDTTTLKQFSTITNIDNIGTAQSGTLDLLQSLTSDQVDTLYSISTAQATNIMLGSVNEWVKSLYDVQSQARALDTASLSSSSFAAGHVLGTQEKIDFAQKTGLTIGSESFNKAITDIQGFATKSDDIGYLAGLSGLNGSSVSNTSILSSIKSLGSLAPSDAQSALTGVSSLLNTSAKSEYDANIAKHNSALSAYNEISGVIGRFNKIHKDWWQSTNEAADNATLQKYGSGGFNTNEKRGENANQAMYNSYVALADSYLAESNKYNIPLKTTFGFAVGTPNVPYDMTANIHQGEIIVPKNFSEGLRNGSLNMGSNRDLIEEIRALRKEVSELKQVNINHMNETVNGNNFDKRISDGGYAIPVRMVV
jgi:tape measure domain-containing protein